MDVRCDRCGTEYDFDDALVSERGTTVKCTNCGHQFKVFPARTLGQPERWVVRTTAGRQLIYTSLRDLQKGIAEGQVGPEDQLSRGGQPARPLGAIAELEPFFRTKRQAPVRVARTIAGVAPPPELVSDPGTASKTGSDRAPAAPSAPPATGTGGPFLPSPSNRPPAVHVERADAARGRVNTAPRLPQPSKQPETVRFGAAEPEPPTVRRNPLVEEAPPVHPVAQRPQAPAFGTSSQPPASTPPRPASNAPRAARLDPTGAEEPARTASGVETPRVPTDPAALRAAAADEATGPQSGRAAPREPATAPAGSPRPPSAGPPLLSAVDSLPIAQPSASDPQGTLEADSDASLRLEADRVAADAAEMLRAGRSPAARADSGRELGVEEFYTPPPREVTFAGSLTDADYRFVPPSHARHLRVRWVVALVLLAAIALVAGTVGVRALRSLAQPRSDTAAQDPRLSQLVASGNRALENGDLDAARDDLMKASALAENDPGLLVALARLETVRADLMWLKLRLLDPGDKELIQSTHRALGSRVGKARTAVDAATRAQPEDLRVLRARVNTLRIAGEVAPARALVAPLAAQASDPANAYVLGTLDLAEPSPSFRAVIERLRTAAAGEGELGLARAALVYALALSGEVEPARSELRRLEGNPHPHALAQELGAFVRRFEETDAGSAIGSEIPTIDVASLGVLDTRPADDDRATTSPAAADFRVLLSQAGDALRAKDLARADKLYRAVLARQPENTEALAGVAEVARQRNDPAASKMLDDVLKRNPNYLPALVSSADQKWSSGDRAGALVLYRRILEDAGADSSYGQHAAARIAEARTAKDDKKPAGDEPPPAPSVRGAGAPTTAPPPEHPEIDTTDLPGF